MLRPARPLQPLANLNTDLADCRLPILIAVTVDCYAPDDLAIAARTGRGKIRQRLRLTMAAGLASHERIGDFLAADFGGGIASRGENWDALLGVMRIRGEHVDGVVFQQPVRRRGAPVLPRIR